MCTASEYFFKLPLSVTPIRIIPVIKRLRNLGRIHFFCKIFIYIHKNQFAPQAQDLLEKLAEVLLFNFHREHIFLKLKIKKLLRKNKSKNLSAGVFFFRTVEDTAKGMNMFIAPSEHIRSFKSSQYLFKGHKINDDVFSVRCMRRSR